MRTYAAGVRAPRLGSLLLLPAAYCLGHRLAAGSSHLGLVACLALPLAGAALLRAFVTGRSGQRASLGIGTLLAAQLVLFLAVEGGELALTGDGPTRALVLGVAAQALAAVVLVGLVSLFHRAGAAFAHTRSRTARPVVARPPVAVLLHGLDVALGSISPRGPPLA
jgi:hypothetical protein